MIRSCQTLFHSCNPSYCNLKRGHRQTASLFDKMLTRELRHEASIRDLQSLCRTQGLFLGTHRFKSLFIPTAFLTIYFMYTVWSTFLSGYFRVLEFQTFATFWMLYAFFWVIPRRLNFICRRFVTLSFPSS